MNKSSLKSTVILCVSIVVCVAIVLVSASHCISRLTDSNNKIVELVKNSVQENSDVDNIIEDSGSAVTNQNLGEIESAPSDDNNSVDNQSSEQNSSTQTVEGNTTPPAEIDGTDEILNYFNTAVNKVKPTAKKVVKNYEKRTYHEDKTEIPEALEATAGSMVSTMMADDTDPIVYSTKEEIEANFIVPEQNYSSKLKSEWVKTATREDNGKEYIIHIVLKDQKNPTAGNGVGSVCDVIETHEVANKVSFVEEFSTLYYNCEIVANIDKATGNVTHINYKTPLLLNMRVNLFGTHSGVIAFTFEKDYTITY